MNPGDYLKNAKAYFWNESFAIFKSEYTNPDAFACITDKDEITVIIDQGKVENNLLSEHEKGWKILTLDVVFPMDTVGILARISDVLAKRGISLMTISAYSRDHFLVREKDMPEVTEALQTLGILIE
jgi:hypothetical protein